MSRAGESDHEIEQMATLVREAIDAGACGFATSFAITHLGAEGKPIPSRWADRAEIAALCKASAEGGRSVIGINGAAARLVHKGDTVIVISYGQYDREEMEQYEPRVVHVETQTNRIITVDDAVATLLSSAAAPFEAATQG